MSSTSTMTWQDWTLLIGSVVAAAGAAGATLFALLAVIQTGRLRREDRLARLGELAGEYGAVLLRVINGAAHERVTGLPVARARLEAAVATAGDALPACTALLAVDTSSSPDNAIERIGAATDELARHATS